MIFYRFVVPGFVVPGPEQNMGAQTSSTSPPTTELTNEQVLSLHTVLSTVTEAPFATYWQTQPQLRLLAQGQWSRVIACGNAYVIKLEVDDRRVKDRPPALLQAEWKRMQQCQGQPLVAQCIAAGTEEVDGIHYHYCIMPNYGPSSTLVCFSRLPRLLPTTRT